MAVLMYFFPMCVMKDFIVELKLIFLTNIRHVVALIICTYLAFFLKLASSG